jgi:hypothetical protein
MKPPVCCWRPGVRHGDTLLAAEVDGQHAPSISAAFKVLVSSAGRIDIRGSVARQLGEGQGTTRISCRHITGGILRSFDARPVVFLARLPLTPLDAPST